MCGDHKSKWMMRVGSWGSSPHVRGPRLDELVAGHAGGIIPTRVGPRNDRQGGLEERGIIPTRVGTTATRPSRPSATRDHPHTRGDLSARQAAGSSPHAWGPPRLAELGEGVAGIIPTRVGTTARRWGPCRPRTDHPHTRGDHLKSFERSAQVTRSSPHAWGPQLDVHEGCRRRGIIPTRVGTTRSNPTRKSKSGDHPHTRGDHWSTFSLGSAVTGSSPHAWGPRRAPGLLPDKGGIIPTRVGTTAVTSSTAVVDRDHPHTRGDHTELAQDGFEAPGSSPHAWGPTGLDGVLVPAAGIIPTRVGTNRA